MNLGDQPLFLVCEAKERTWRLPPKPSGCEYEWPAYVELGASGPGKLGVCTSNPLVEEPDPQTGEWVLGGPVIPYGSSIRIQGIVCRSRVAGLTCTNRDGHGFFLSRQQVKVF